MLQLNQEIFNTYKSRLELKKYAYSENTKTQYVKIVTPFVEQLEKSILDVKRKDIIIYLDNLNLTSASFNKKLSSIQNMYTILIDSMLYDEMEYNPAIGIKRGKIKASETSALTEEQINSLLQNCKNSRDYAVLTVLCNTGLRVHELIALTLEQYEKIGEEKVINLKVTKGNKNGVVYLNEKCIKAINAYLKDRKNGCENLFVSNYGNKLDATCLNRTWKTIAKRAGLKSDDVKGLHNHSYRHYTATTLLNKGVAIDVVQQVLRHSNIQTTTIYAKTSNQSVKNAMACL